MHGALIGPFRIKFYFALPCIASAKCWQSEIYGRIAILPLNPDGRWFRLPARLYKDKLHKDKKEPF